MGEDDKEEELAEHGGFAPVYMIELWAEEPIEIDDDAVRDVLEEEHGPIDRPAPSKDLTIHFLRAHLPAQVCLMRGERRTPHAIEASLQQSWRLEDAAARVARVRHAVLLNDLMASNLEPSKRRGILATTLLAVLRHSNVELVHFLPTQQFLSAEDARTSLEREPDNATTGFLNVRFFNIADSPGDMIMDTLGLTALGLTDFQIHYRRLTPNDVAQVLHSIGSYVLENGPVIEDGHTIEGTTNGSKWRCRHEVSLLEPKRVVLDINPGPKYAAGGRTSA